MSYEIPVQILKLADELQEKMDSLGAKDPMQENYMYTFNNMGAAQLFKAVQEYRKEKGNE